MLYTLRPRQSGRHFANHIFKWIFLNEKIWILIKILLRTVPMGPINNNPALVQIMAWHRPGNKPLYDPIMASLPTHIYVTRPQWVKSPYHYSWRLKALLRPMSGNDTTVGTPYNTNVGVQKIPDRAIWKPVVAKRNNTNPWSCSKPQILVTRDSRQVHMAERPAEQPASRDRLGVNFSLHAFITDCLTTL